MITLVCGCCHRPLRFGERGWEHRDSDTDCKNILVAWPPPSEEDEAAFQEA